MHDWIGSGGQPGPAGGSLRFLPGLHLFFGLLLADPLQAGKRTFALRVDLQGPFEVGNAGTWPGNRCQDQPGVFHVRCQRGGNLCPGAGSMFIAVLQGFGGLIQDLAG